tara:strand:- start:4 stop:1077 length:1074 start_codon:yes stop_codon:yes gene_type:complete
MAYTTIDDSSAHFQTALYTGNAGVITVTNDGNSDLQPDWLWLKARDIAQPGTIRDSSRGTNKFLYANDTNAEGTNSYVTSLNSDGFSMNATDNEVNGSGNTYVAWQWIANGGTTASNSDGSITSTVQANTTAGFSIITYSGNGTAGATVGHGLGVTPNWVIIKNRGSSARGWIVYHDKSHATPEDNFTLLNTNAAVADLNRMNDTAPTSSVFSVSDDTHVNNGSDTYVAYCFANIQGYSKFGGYNGNGNADGPFVYTGFKPAWVMTKRTDTTGNWYIYDSTRNGSSGSDSNQVHKILYSNDVSAEIDNSSRGMDMNANGFKIRNTLNDTNNSSGTYIYMAFAHHPFVSSEGVPVTAR